MARLSGDWPYWVVGLALAAVAAFFLYRALVHDRARGRRRCPKCWYVMDGAPGPTCPECGHGCANDRRLRRTHRRWGRASAAAAVLALGLGITRVPGYQRSGWFGLVPSTVLVTVAPAQYLPMPAGGVGLAGGRLPPSVVTASAVALFAAPAPPARATNILEETWRRLQAGTLARWQSQLFLSRVLRSKPVPNIIEVPDRWVAGHEMFVPATANSPLRGVVAARARIAGAAKPTRFSGFRTYLRTPPTAAPAVPVSMELYRATTAGEQVLYSAVVTTIDLRASSEVLLDRLTGPPIDETVRGLLKPRIAETDGQLVVRVNDKSFDAGLPCIVGLRAEILLGRQPIGRTGETALNSFERTIQPWIDLPIQWEPGGRDRALAAGRVEVRIDASPAAAGEMYMRHPYKLPPACWDGSLTFMLDLPPPP
jgi:hypothetical protein